MAGRSSGIARPLSLARTPHRRIVRLFICNRARRKALGKRSVQRGCGSQRPQGTGTPAISEWALESWPSSLAQQPPQENACSVRGGTLNRTGLEDARRPGREGIDRGTTWPAGCQNRCEITRGPWGEIPCACTGANGAVAALPRPDLGSASYRDAARVRAHGSQNPKSSRFSDSRTIPTSGAGTTPTCTSRWPLRCPDLRRNGRRAS